MKKVYLVRKDPEKPAAKDNWIIMNGYEFAMFLKTPEGEKRKTKFARLEAMDDEENIYYAECDPETKKTWEAASHRTNYIRKVRHELEIQEYSIDWMVAGDDERSGEEMLSEKGNPVEDALFAAEELRILHEAIKKLDEKEQQIVRLLYFSGEKGHDRDVAKVLGMSPQNLQYHKKKLLMKLRSLLEQEEF